MWYYGAGEYQKTREGCGCLKFLAGNVFRQISTLLENYSPVLLQHEMLSLPRFGHFPARKMAAGKSAAPAGTLLKFLLRDRHSLLELHVCRAMDGRDELFASSIVAPQSGSSRSCVGADRQGPKELDFNDFRDASQTQMTCGNTISECWKGVA